MAGAACKVIINNGLRALTTSLEQILVEMPLSNKMDENTRQTMIQDLADVDIASLTGNSSCGLIDIMERLQSLGILSDDVWRVYAHSAPPLGEVSIKKPKEQKE